MKISAQDEYGLRILLQIGRADRLEGLSISQLSELEGISQAYVAKITRRLRQGGLISSTRGQKGGYVLARSPEDITVSQILQSLDGQLYDGEFCQGHTGNFSLCTHSVDCSIRSLWKIMQVSIDRLLEKVTLQDLIQPESEASQQIRFVSQREALSVKRPATNDPASSPDR